MRQTPPAKVSATAAEQSETEPRPEPSRQPVVQSGEVHLILNGEPLTLPVKEEGNPYYLMDLLEYSGIDFEHLDRAVRLEVNGVERGFQHPLKEQDSVTITLAEKT